MIIFWFCLLLAQCGALLAPFILESCLEAICHSAQKAEVPGPCMVIPTCLTELAGLIALLIPGPCLVFSIAISWEHSTRACPPTSLDGWALLILSTLIASLLPLLSIFFAAWVEAEERAWDGRTRFLP